MDNIVWRCTREEMEESPPSVAPVQALLVWLFYIYINEIYYICVLPFLSMCVIVVANAIGSVTVMALKVAFGLFHFDVLPFWLHPTWKMHNWWKIQHLPQEELSLSISNRDTVNIILGLSVYLFNQTTLYIYHRRHVLKVRCHGGYTTFHSSSTGTLDISPFLLPTVDRRRLLNTFGKYAVDGRIIAFSSLFFFLDFCQQ